MNYFDKIPSIDYEGYTAKNLLARSKLSDATKANKMAFYPYTMDADSDRVDKLSNNYYDSPGYSWLVWYSNDVVDPYFDMPLAEEDLYAHIMTKYGTLETAMRGIIHYRQNWYGSEEKLSPAEYEALDGNWKKYYDPVVLSSDYIVHSYVRKREDTVVSTNKKLSINFNVSVGTFSVGEEIQVDGTNYGFCVASNETSAIIQHVTGSFAEGQTITGTTSNASATIASTTLLSETLASTDAIFWSPVTFFDYEQELNSQKKEIQLLDVRYRGQAEAELKRSMSSR